MNHDIMQLHDDIFHECRTDIVEGTYYHNSYMQIDKATIRDFREQFLQSGLFNNTIRRDYS